MFHEIATIELFIDNSKDDNGQSRVHDVVALEEEGIIQSISRHTIGKAIPELGQDENKILPEIVKYQE